jgi:TPR repeat protein
MDNQPQKEMLAQAEAGDPEAQNALGRFYAQRGLDPENSKAAEQWFHRAADQGFAAAKYNLGVLALKAGRVAEATDWFVAAVDLGWPPAFFALGKLGEEAGESEKAGKLYEWAAARGNADAQDALGRRAFELETDEGYATARYWSELAAEQGNAYSQTRLGTIYHEGLGVERDPRRAAAYWLSAAQAGHDGAQLAIGAAYHLGIGVPVDRVEAAYFLSLSAAQGNEFAQAYLPRAQKDLSGTEKAEVELRLRQAGNAQSGSA